MCGILWEEEHAPSFFRDGDPAPGRAVLHGYAGKTGRTACIFTRARPPLETTTLAPIPLETASLHRISDLKTAHSLSKRTIDRATIL